MATFPHILCGIKFGDHAEQEDSAYLRSEVERGVARQRRNQADTRVSVPCTLLFKSKADADAWRTWFGYEGGGWFDFTLPRTGSVVPARVVGGNIGTLKPRSPDWEWSERSITLEYIRPGFVQLPPGLHSVNPARVLSVQRNSTATYVDDAGLLQTAAANVARYQGGMMLVEGEATNLVLQSQALNTLAWFGCTVSAATEVYRGLVPFWLVAKSTTSGSESFGQYFGAVFSGDAMTTTAALLAGSVAQCSLGLFIEGGWGLSEESTAAVLEGPGVISARTGSLFTVTGLSATVPTLVRITRTFTEAGHVSVLFYPGVHTSTTAGHSVKVTRVQFEDGADATSYIPTTAAPATRAADIITVAA